MKNLLVSIVAVISSWFGIHSQIPANQAQPISQQIQIQTQASTSVQSDVRASGLSDDSYYSYTNQKEGYSFDLPTTWKLRYSDNSGDQIYGISTSSNSSTLNYSEQLTQISLMPEFIQISFTSTPQGGATLGRVWASLFNDSTEATISGKSPIIKDVKVKSAKGQVNACTGYDYSVLTNTRIYSFFGCAKNTGNLAQVKGYIEKMIQTLREH